MNKIFIAFIALGILLLGCAGTPTTSLYVLHVNQIPEETETTPLKVGIQPFSIDPVYSNRGIAYQQTPYKIQFYHYHQWASSPVNLINQTLLTYLKQSNHFSLVCQLPSPEKLDYILTGQILKFAEWNEGNKWFGWMELNIQLVHEKTNEIAWKGQISKKIPAKKRNPVSVVKALSEAVKQIAEDIAEKINTQ